MDVWLAWRLGGIDEKDHLIGLASTRELAQHACRVEASQPTGFMLPKLPLVDLAWRDTWWDDDDSSEAAPDTRWAEARVGTSYRVEKQEVT